MNPTAGAPWLRLTRAVTATLGMVALAVAVPVALIRGVGWPLPTTVPDPAALGEPIPDTAIINALAVVCWIAWAQLMASVTAEVIALARGRTPRRLPLGGPTQRLAAWLVASIVLAGGVHASPAPRPLAAGGQAAPSPNGRLAHLVPEPSLVASTRQTPPAPSTSSNGERSYVVVPRDTLWGIAGRELGDPFRWPEIFKRNRGVPQPDGGAVTDPGHIRPGWILILPATQPPVAAADGRAVVVVPGDTLWDIADSELGDGARWPELFQPNRGVTQPDGRALQDPDLIHPGWTLTLPPLAASSAPTTPSEPVDAQASTPPPAPPTTTPPAPTPTTTPAPARTRPTPPEPAPPTVDVDADDGGEDSQTVPVGVIGAGLAAAGIVLTLDRMRRARQRRRLPGDPPITPNPDHADLERRLRADAEDAAGDVDRVDLALRALGDGLARHRRTPAPQVLAAQLADGRIELLLERPDPTAPPGFDASDDGWVWTADTTDIDRFRPSADRISPIPALVTVGTTETGPLLVNLEAAGTLEAVGDPDPVRRTLTHLALELATSAWADHVNVAIIGDDGPPLSGLARVRWFATAAEAADQLAIETAETATALEATGTPSAFAARTARGATEGWPPLVVVCPDRSTERDLDALLSLAGNSPGALSLLAAGPNADAHWTLTCTGDRVEIAPLGITVVSSARFETEPDGIAALLNDAASDAGPAAAHPAPDTAATTSDPESPGAATLFPHTTHAPPAADDRQVEGEVEVRVLGPIEIVGSDHPINGGKPAELITYLAVHPAGVLGDQLKAVLWPPDRPPSPRTFSNTVSAARKLLGARHFPPARRELYRLRPTVGIELSRFESHVRDAATAPDDKAAELLDQALDLVRGEPYTAPHGFHWPQPEGHVSSAQTTVVDAAHRLTQLRLAAGDPTLADEAARKGLRAEPLNEILYRDRMLAADAAGNPAGVKAVMQELLDHLEADDPASAVHPETLALYRELVSHRPG